MTINVEVKKLHPDARLPEYMSEGAACFDLFALKEKPEYSPALRRAIVRTGLAFQIPDDHVMLIFSRSGDGFKRDTRLANCVGVIDSDYRGEVKVKLTRDTANMVEVEPGQSVAQVMIIPRPRIKFNVADELNSTERGEGGFGSTDS